MLTRNFLLVALVAMLLVQTEAAPIVTRTDRGVTVDVWPFFRMDYIRDNGGKLLDIDVLSGMVKVGYDRLAGKSPNVDVSVFGLGSNRKRVSNPGAGTTDQGFEIQ